MREMFTDSDNFGVSCKFTIVLSLRIDGSQK